MSCPGLRSTKGQYGFKGSGRVWRSLGEMHHSTSWLVRIISLAIGSVLIVLADRMKNVSRLGGKIDGVIRIERLGEVLISGNSERISPARQGSRRRIGKTFLAECLLARVRLRFILTAAGKEPKRGHQET